MAAGLLSSRIPVLRHQHPEDLVLLALWVGPFATIGLPLALVHDGEVSRSELLFQVVVLLDLWLLREDLRNMRAQA